MSRIMRPLVGSLRPTRNYHNNSPAVSATVISSADTKVIFQSRKPSRTVNSAHYNICKTTRSRLHYTDNNNISDRLWCNSTSSGPVWDRIIIIVIVRFNIFFFCTGTYAYAVVYNNNIMYVGTLCAVNNIEKLLLCIAIVMKNRYGKRYSVIVFNYCCYVRVIYARYIAYWFIL